MCFIDRVGRFMDSQRHFSLRFVNLFAGSLLFKQLQIENRGVLLPAGPERAQVRGCRGSCSRLSLRRWLVSSAASPSRDGLAGDSAARRAGERAALCPQESTGRSSEKHWMGGTFGTIPKYAVLCKRKKRSGVASVASESEDAVKDFQLID